MRPPLGESNALDLLGFLRKGEGRRDHDRVVAAILENIAEGYAVIDRQYRIIASNKAFFCHHGSTEETVRGRFCYEISHGSDRPCHERGEQCPLQLTLETGKAQCVTHTHSFPGKKKTITQIRSFPVRDETGLVISVVELFVDITERALLEEKLIHTQRMEAVGQLAGGTAHDFNNLLTAIMGYCDLLSVDLGPGHPSRGHIEEILASARRGAALTRGLLAFSRKQVLSLKAVCLNGVVEKAGGLLSRLIGEDIAIRLDLCEENPRILADESQLDQVLMNLATNSRDAMARGGTIVIDTGLLNMDTGFIALHGYGAPGRYARITFTDDGEGMSETVRERIFEPFFTTKGPDRGTGLGLSTVYGIVKQHDGYIDIDSEPARGTTFTLYFPAIDQPCSPPPQPAQDPPGLTGDETILLAEDEESVRTYLGKVLERYGYRVLTAPDGAAALAAIEEPGSRIDLCILDVIMPKMDGREVYERVRSRRPEMKVCFISGYAAEYLARKGALDEGMSFLAKPFEITGLLRKIRCLLDG